MVTLLALAGHTVLSLAAGAALIGLVTQSVRLEERILIAVVAGIILPSTATLLISLFAGLNPTTVYLGPVAVIGLVALACRRGAADPRDTWSDAWDECRARWATHPRIGFVVFGVVMAVVMTYIFGHAISYDTAGDLNAGYSVVWSDWSQHLSTENSFAIGQNIPPANNLYGGTALLYPFMPDFHSAELAVLGMSPATALVVPGPVLAVSISLLLVSFAVRIGFRGAVGGLTAIIGFIGGGFGFARAASDACINAVTGLDPLASQTPGTASASAYTLATSKNYGCDLHQLVTTPSAWIGVLRHLPTIVMNQPRGYDGLSLPFDQLPMHNIQWYTPLYDWWLPQRGIAYGAAAVLAVLVIIAAALGDSKPSRSAWIVGGVIAACLPLFHVHSFLALAAILFIVMLWNRRREWFYFIGVTAGLAAPRLLQIAAGPHGSVDAGNSYPSFPIGWAYHFDPQLPNQGLDVADHVSAGTIASTIWHVIELPFRPDWWNFWITNLGVAVPLCAVVFALALVRRFFPARWLDYLLSPFPRPSLPWVGGFCLIFIVANIVAVQSWYWDNTKLFAFAYFGAGLLISAVVVHMWRGWWRPLLSVVLVFITTATGALALVRTLPAEAQASRVQVTGPFTMASADNVRVAAQIAANTPANAVFVSGEGLHDPAVMLAGRTTIVGYGGWLSSYGIVYGDRDADVRKIIAGCGSQHIRDASCPVLGLLRKYGATYVEINTQTDYGVTTDGSWWSQQGLKVVAQGGSDTVYAVPTSSS